MGSDRAQGTAESELVAMTIDEIEKWAVSELKSQHHDVDWLESFGRHFRLVVRGACERAREPHPKFSPDERNNGAFLTEQGRTDIIKAMNERVNELTARVEKIERMIPPGFTLDTVAEAAARFGLGPTVGSKS